MKRNQRGEARSIRHIFSFPQAVVIAALSHHVNFAIGCYCEDEARCHRSILRKLLEARGADINS